MTMCIHSQDYETCSFGCTFQKKEELKLENDKLQVENKRLKEALEFAKKEITTFSLQLENTSEKGFALAEGINNKIDELTKR